jgi:hypothetical protein
MSSIIETINKRLPDELKREIASFALENKLLTIMKEEISNWDRRNYFNRSYFNTIELRELKEKRKYQRERDEYYFKTYIEQKWTLENIVKLRHNMKLDKIRMNKKIKELNGNITVTTSDKRDQFGNYHTLKLNGVIMTY